MKPTMIDYTVTLEFDKETENKIQELIDEVAKVNRKIKHVQFKTN